VRVAISAEFAGLLATQKPGMVSKIATLMSPPAFGVVGVDDARIQDESTVETTIVAATAAPMRRNKRAWLV